MRNVRRIGELNARVSALEERFAAMELELASLRLPGVEFVTEASLEIGVSVGHEPAVAFDAEGKMEVWV